jgi:tRNA(Arg) A34 adenosine deaminase TadA
MNIEDSQMNLKIIFSALNECFTWYIKPNSDTDISLKNHDEYYMQIAINLAEKNPNEPFAGVIVDNDTGKIMATGINAVHLNPTFHGEMVTINNCAQHYPHLDWSTVTLYSTAEPCAMCQSAAAWAGISRVVYATSSEYLVKNGWLDILIPAREVNKRAPFYHGKITSGVLSEKANLLFKNKNMG